MRIVYRRVRTALLKRSKHLVLGAGLVILPLTAKLEKAASVPHTSPTPAKGLPEASSRDPRTTRLSRFLASLHSPVLTMAQDFVQAADQNHLDWRLLPSISVVESGGGKAYRNNNIFGWNKGLQTFPSIRAGLDTVAYRLSHSPLYRNRDIVGKLHLYNPDETYASKVIGVMNRISPIADLSARRSIPRRVQYSY